MQFFLTIGVAITDQSEGTKYGIPDLMQQLASRDAIAFEIAMLSALLVFKDVLPSYRIRSDEDLAKEKEASGKDIQLKKETKALRDFERALLRAYKSYIGVLAERITEGLGADPRSVVADWTTFLAPLGLSALRCQCELLRSHSHFNFRSLLLQSIVSRACQPSFEVHSLCCETLRTLFANDTSGEVSCEAVRLIAKVLHAPQKERSGSLLSGFDALLRTLKTVKLSVHADQSRSVHQKARSERKRRKKSREEGDAVEVGLLESSAKSDEANRRRFQADCLQEITVIYFRCFISSTARTTFIHRRMGWVGLSKPKEVHSSCPRH